MAGEIPHLNPGEELVRLMDPQPGDYWHDHFAFRLWVVAVNETDVLWATACPPCELPRDVQWEWGSKHYFFTRYRHEGADGFWRPTLSFLKNDVRSTRWLEAAPEEWARHFTPMQNGACQVWDGL